MPKNEAPTGHSSCPKTHYMTLGTAFTYLYLPALSDVCPTFLLFHCRKLRVLTPSPSLRAHFSEPAAAARVAQRPFNSQVSQQGSSSLPLPCSQATQRSFCPDSLPTTRQSYLKRLFVQEVQSLSINSGGQFLDNLAARQSSHIVGIQEHSLPLAEEEALFQQCDDHKNPTPEPHALHITQLGETGRGLNSPWKYSFCSLICLSFFV